MREVEELRRVNEKLKDASNFFAAVENGRRRRSRSWKGLPARARVRSRLLAADSSRRQKQEAGGQEDRVGDDHRGRKEAQSHDDRDAEVPAMSATTRQFFNFR